MTDEALFRFALPGFSLTLNPVSGARSCSSILTPPVPSTAPGLCLAAAARGCLAPEPAQRGTGAVLLHVSCLVSSPSHGCLLLQIGLFHLNAALSALSLACETC